MKDPIELQPPGGDRLLIGLRVEQSRDSVSFTPLDNLLLNLGHGPAIGTLVSESPKISIAGSAHVVSCSIAPNTG